MSKRRNLIVNYLYAFVFRLNEIQILGVGLLWCSTGEKMEIFIIVCKMYILFISMNFYNRESTLREMNGTLPVEYVQQSGCSSMESAF